MKKLVCYLVVMILFVVGASVSGKSVADNSYLILVNKTHSIPEDWESRVVIDEVENSLGEKHRIEHETYESYLKLREELLEKGVQIELDSVYRSVAEQEETMQWFLENYGEEYAKQYVATPGYSEHHTGLAVDIFVMRGDEQIRDNDDMIADTEDFEIIHQLLPKYGFILRYLEGKEDITGYNYEPWHFRYIANPGITQEITDKGITLEEYLGTY